MKRKTMIIIFSLTMAFLLSLPVFAGYEAVTSPVIGSWMLDKVYENASGPDRFVLDPENAASLYAEKDNIYAFLTGGTAEMTMEGLTQFGYWEQNDEWILMVINSTAGQSDENAEAKPDIDPPFETEYFYDDEQNVLHRYWKEDDPAAAYHDLDFVYKKIPQGVWRLTKVYSREPGQEPVLLDPESSQSLYAESVNRYTLFRSQVTEMIPVEDGGSIIENGILKRSGDDWLLVMDDGFETQMSYDDRNETLHRYWIDNAPDAYYLDLDFVYEMIP